MDIVPILVIAILVATTFTGGTKMIKNRHKEFGPEVKLMRKV